MRITGKKSPLVGEYNIEGQPLESVNVYKDLWLFTASNLSWNQHIDHTERNIDKLEAVQLRATRWITRFDDDYGTRLSKLKLLSLTNRRFTRDVTLFF